MKFIYVKINSAEVKHFDKESVELKINFESDNQEDSLNIKFILAELPQLPRIVLDTLAAYIEKKSLQKNTEEKQVGVTFDDKAGYLKKLGSFSDELIHHVNNLKNRGKEINNGVNKGSVLEDLNKIYNRKINF